MPDENSNKFTMPETLDGLEGPALETLLAQAEAAFIARHDQGVTTKQDVDELQEIARHVEAIRAASAAAPTDSDAGESGEEEIPVPDAEPEPAPEAEPEAPEAAQPHPAEALLEIMLRSQAQTQAEAPAPVAEAAPPAAAAPAAPAIAAPVSLAAAGGVEDVQLPVSDSSWVIVASSDIPNVPSGSRLKDKSALVAAIGEKARSLSVTAAGGPRGDYSRVQSHPVAAFELPLGKDRWLDDLSMSDAMQAIGDLSSPAALLASGGWCAPSETIYNFSCNLEEMTGMLDLPTFGTRRGGVRYPISPSYADFDAGEGLRTWTEDDDIAAATGAPTKGCFTIPCVDFDEDRLELEGLCATAGNLTDQAYPELIQRYMELLLTAHFHRMNSAKIAKALSIMGAAVVLAATFGAASSTYSGLLLQVADLRDKHAMGPNALLEGAAPRWLRGLFKADIARREREDLSSISNADVGAYLLDAGVRMQFVSDWQALGAASAATTWPTTVDVMLWPAGQLREMTGPRLNIAVARDSVLNATNDYTVAFTEQAYQISAMGGCGHRRVRIPVCPDGSYGSPVDLTCPVA